MSALPPNNDDPSSRFSFDDQPPRQQPFGVNIPPQNAQVERRTFFNPGKNDQTGSLREDIIEEVDDALGITDRLLGCSWWMLTLPFRLVWKVIQAVTD